MTYHAPEVEEFPDTDDATTAAKRKRADESSSTSPIHEKSADEDFKSSEPPSKAAKSRNEATLNDTNEDGDKDESFLDDEDELEEGNLDEDLSAEGDDEVEEQDEKDEKDTKQKKPQSKFQSKSQTKSRGSPSGEKLQKTIEMYGRGPLEGTAIEDQALSGSPDTILAMLMDAMLKSKPMSHELTDRTLRKLVEVGYHDIQKLGDASWEKRAMVLKDGGYNRYREQGSTNLGKLVEFVNEKYDGDLNNLMKSAKNDPQKARQLVKEVHGLGDLGVELFFNNVQSVWPSIAPFVDSRSMQTAEEAGLGTDLQAIYGNLEKDSVKMCKLANALSAARLDKRVGDLVAI
ncbi:uncharacterized protein BDV14DRAFT_166604 [Aspergillus stella-maris]|uniref:uncharacterized protein n=1 Tax=Aspergillus stella-maris TaxID=1810926 RepID=UPI003CCD83A2